MTAQLGNTVGFVDKRQTQGSKTDNITTPANFADESSLDARLTAIGGYYTATVIAGMTHNDKVYAVRLNDEAASV